MRLYARTVSVTVIFPVVFSLGCATSYQTGAFVAVGVTVAGSAFPSSEIQVIYYLVVYDPQDQLPPTVYRVQIHGQASSLNLTNFASGWVRAELIDSLNSSGHFMESSDHRYSFRVGLQTTAIAR